MVQPPIQATTDSEATDLAGAVPPKPKLDKEAVQEMHGWVQEMYEDARGKSARYARRWAENMAMYRGFQHGVPTVDGLFAVGELDDRQEFETINLIQAILKQAVARRLQSFPLNPDVTSPHTGVVARASAEASAQLVRSFPRNGSIPFEEIRDATYSSEILGAAWLQVFWDPYKGKPDTASGVPPGDLNVRFVSIQEGIPDPTARNEPAVRHVFHVKDMARSSAVELYPTDAFGDEPSFEGYATRDFGNQPSAVGDDLWTDDGAEPNQIVRIIEYWERPSLTYPRGRLMCFSGSCILDVQVELPTPWPWIFIPGSNPVPGKLIPDGLIHNLKSPQRSLNHAQSKIRENLSLAAAPAILVDTSSGIEARRFTDMAGEVIRHAPGHRPQWMTPPSIGSGLFEQTNKLPEFMSQMSAYADASQGTPQGDLSGRAMQVMSEQNNLAHGPDHAVFRAAMVQLLKCLLETAFLRYEEGRVVRMLGVNNRWMVRAWKSTDFDADIDIIVDPFSTRPASRAARFAEAVEILQLNGYEDSPAGKAFRRHIELDTDDKNMIDLEQVHRRRAQDEDIQTVTTGVVPQVQWEDDDEVHLPCHEGFLLSEEFLLLPPEVQQGHRQHIANHEMNMAQKMMPPGGAGGGPPGAGQGAMGPSGAGGEAKSPQSASPQDGGWNGQGTSTDEVVREQGQRIAAQGSQSFNVQ